MAERRILVIGGSGQLGRELTALSWPPGFDVIAPPRKELDATDQSAVAAYLGTGDWTAVINAAAYTAVDAAEDAVAEAFACQRPGSGDPRRGDGGAGVFRSSRSRPTTCSTGPSRQPYVEDDPTHPLGVYGASKLAGEEAVRTGNPHHIIVRTSWLFSRFGKNFVKTMLRLAGERESVSVVDDQLGTPTAASDLAAAIVTIAATPDLGERAGIYHFANRGETTWCGLARRIFALSKERGGPSATVEAIATADYPTPARRPANSRLSTAKIERVFGIVPRPWEEALADVVASLVPVPERPPVR